jgi:hypothetical protein
MFAVNVGLPSPEYRQPTLFKIVLEIASSQVGVLEDPPGSNRGPEVENTLKASAVFRGIHGVPPLFIITSMMQ